MRAKEGSNLHKELLRRNRSIGRALSKLSRLESHLDQFLETTNKQLAIGGTLEVISQELGRELNTLSAKANDAEISQIVVRAKPSWKRSANKSKMWNETALMNIILGVTASIAAYKAADLASKLTKQDRSVHVLMTAGATQFVLRLLCRHCLVIPSPPTSSTKR